MFPFLFTIGNFYVMTYYVMVFIGILAGLLVLYFNIKNSEQTKQLKIFIFSIVIFIPFILGSRIGYTIECFISNKNICSLSIIGPCSLLWGMFFSVISAFFIAKLLNLIVWEIADLFALSISIGGFFTRLGCFFNGCCFGIPCNENFPFGIYYPYTSYAGKLFENIPVHPTQIYLSLTWLVIFIFLTIYKKYQKFHGELFFIMTFLFSLSNFFIEFLRFHEIKHFLSTAQILSIIAGIISIFAYILFVKFNLFLISQKKNGGNLTK